MKKKVKFDPSKGRWAGFSALISLAFGWLICPETVADVLNERLDVKKVD